jgi:uncharacterized protein with von Willebrand factor type A (vWA) domain
LQKPVVFEFLFERLRQEGFRLGYDHHLRLQELLNRIQCKPEDLGSVLAPLYATTPLQQRRFLEIFAEVYAGIAKTSGPTPSPFWKFRFPLRWMAWVVLMLGAIAGGSWLIDTLSPETLEVRPLPPPRYPPPELEENSEAVPVPRRERQYAIQIPLQLLPKPTRHWEPLRASLTLLPWAGFAVYLIRLRRQRKTLLDRGQTLPPPHYWPLRVDALGAEVFQSVDLRSLARRMRARQDGGHRRLDIVRTIRSTIRRAGYPRFAYQPVQRPPEYLVLIERRSLADHFACLIGDLFRILEAEGVYHSRYYFEGDPRSLTTESGQSIRLEELAGRSARDRLLVFGASGCFVHPVTGRLEDWAIDLWSRWPMRAALLSDAPGKRRLGRLREVGFLCTSADSVGLRQAVDSFTAKANALEPETPAFTPLPSPSGEESEWLAACAVYQEVNWNLSLWLAPEPLTESAASRLARVAWLRDGLIPPPDRERMLAKLPSSRREQVLAKLRSALEQHPPPSGSHAHAMWQTTMRLFDGLEDTRGEGFIEDVTFLRFLQRGDRVDMAFSKRRVDWNRSKFLFAFNLSVMASLLLVPFADPIRLDPVQDTTVAVIDELGRAASNVLLRTGDTYFQANQPVRLLDGSFVVHTLYPAWTKSYSISGSQIRVRVGNGRPVNRPFMIDRYVSAIDSDGSGEIRIEVDYAGRADEVRIEEGGGGSWSPLPLKDPLNWVEETRDGVVFKVTPVRTTTYRWTVGPVTNQTVVNVNARTRVITSFTASPPTIRPGGVSTLRWKLVDYFGLIQVRDQSGRNLLAPALEAIAAPTSLDVSPQRSTTYELRAANEVRRVRVNVTEDNGPGIELFQATPSVLTAPGQVTLSWRIAGSAPDATLQWDKETRTVKQEGTLRVNVFQPSTTFRLTVPGSNQSKEATVRITEGFQLILRSIVCPREMSRSSSFPIFLIGIGSRSEQEVESARFCQSPAPLNRRLATFSPAEGAVLVDVDVKDRRPSRLPTPKADITELPMAPYSQRTGNSWDFDITVPAQMIPGGSSAPYVLYFELRRSGPTSTSASQE